MKAAGAVTAAVLSAFALQAETAAESHAYPISPDKAGDERRGEEMMAAGARFSMRVSIAFLGHIVV